VNISINKKADVCTT